MFFLFQLTASAFRDPGAAIFEPEPSGPRLSVLQPSCFHTAAAGSQREPSGWKHPDLYSPPPLPGFQLPAAPHFKRLWPHWRPDGPLAALSGRLQGPQELGVGPEPSLHRWPHGPGEDGRENALAPSATVPQPPGGLPAGPSRPALQCSALRLAPRWSHRHQHHQQSAQQGAAGERAVGPLSDMRPAQLW